MFNLVLETKTFTPDVGRPLNISGLTAVDTGTPNDYLGTIDLSAIEIGPSGRKVIQVPVTHNNTYRGWGEITFTLRDGQEYTANTEENKHIAKVTIAEAEDSTRKINVSAPDRVIEGEKIEVMLTTTESLGAGESIAVKISVRASPSGFYDLDNSEQSPVTMTSASDTVTFNIATYDSIVLNQNGMIEISVIRGDQYEPASTTAEQVIVVAKDTIPMVTIARISPSSIDEGEDAVFVVSASGITLTQPIGVSVTVAQGASDNFIDMATTTPPSVMVQTNGTGELRIKTKADAIDEPDGKISVTLTKSADAMYLLGNPKVCDDYGEG